MLYSRGIEEDEKKHRVYHSNFTEGVKWGSVKKCEMSSGRVDFLNGRIVRISPHYSTKALDDVVNFLNRTFGGEEDLEGEHALFLWILKKRVRGILLCETISTAHRVLSDVTIKQQFKVLSCFSKFEILGNLVPNPLKSR